MYLSIYISFFPFFLPIYLTIYLQGVPWNMIVARRFERYLWSPNLFETFSNQNSFTCMILETILKNSPWPGNPKMWSAFFVLSFLPEIWRISFRFWQFWFFFNKLKIETLISGNIDSPKKADHILEKPGNCVVIVLSIIHEKIGWQLNVTNRFKYLRRLSHRRATVMFRGTYLY